VEYVDVPQNLSQKSQTYGFTQNAIIPVCCEKKALFTKVDFTHFTQLWMYHVLFSESTGEDEMRYDEFRDQLQIALHNAGLLGQRLGNPSDTIDMEIMERRWKVYVVGTSNDTVPFQVTAKIAFSWNPFNTARSYTCEEDLLTELLGRTKSSAKTEPRFVRVDLELYARLPYGSTTAIPEAQTFGSWADSIKQKLDKAFAESNWRQGRLVAVLGAVEDINVESKCNSAGGLSITGVSIAGFRIVRVPRMWDDPDRRNAEKGAATELSKLAQKFKYSLDQWTVSIAEIAKWIRYTPPPVDAIQVEQPFDEPQDEDAEGGPETIH
jgi:hypothetical protein